MKSVTKGEIFQWIGRYCTWCFACIFYPFSVCHSYALISHISPREYSSSAIIRSQVHRFTTGDFHRAARSDSDLQWNSWGHMSACIINIRMTEIFGTHIYIYIFTPRNANISNCMFYVLESSEVGCWCGWNIREEVTDIGDAGNWPLFPLVALRLGDAGGASEHIYFRIGPLVCKQGMLWKDVYPNSQFRYKLVHSLVHSFVDNDWIILLHIGFEIVVT